MMLRLIARPSPEPPFSRASEESTCSNREKMLSSLSSGMPRPRSRMENSTNPPRGSACDDDHTAAVGELDGVAQQVQQGLDHAVGVGVHLALGPAEADPDAGVLGDHLHLVDRRSIRSLAE